MRNRFSLQKHNLCHIFISLICCLLRLKTKTYVLEKTTQLSEFSSIMLKFENNHQASHDTETKDIDS